MLEFLENARIDGLVILILIILRAITDGENGFVRQWSSRKRHGESRNEAKKPLQWLGASQQVMMMPCCSLTSQRIFKEKTTVWWYTQGLIWLVTREEGLVWNEFGLVISSAQPSPRLHTLRALYCIDQRLPIWKEYKNKQRAPGEHQSLRQFQSSCR